VIQQIFNVLFIDLGRLILACRRTWTYTTFGDI